MADSFHHSHTATLCRDLCLCPFKQRTTVWVCPQASLPSAGSLRLLFDSVWYTMPAIVPASFWLHIIHCLLTLTFNTSYMVFLASAALLVFLLNDRAITCCIFLHLKQLWKVVRMKWIEWNKNVGIHVSLINVALCCCSMLGHLKWLARIRENVLRMWNSNCFRWRFLSVFCPLYCQLC